MKVVKYTEETLPKVHEGTVYIAVFCLIFLTTFAPLVTVVPPLVSHVIISISTLVLIVSGVVAMVTGFLGIYK